MDESTVNLFDCLSALQKTPWNPAAYYDKKHKLIKWETVPPLLELVAEKLVVKNWDPLLEKLLEEDCCAPYYSILLARALFHSKVNMVNWIISKWPSKKMVFLGCPLLSKKIYDHCQMLPIITMITSTFVNCARKGTKFLQEVDLSFCQSYFDLMEIMTEFNVEEENKPCNNVNKKYFLYVHEDIFLKYKSEGNVFQIELDSEGCEMIIVIFKAVRNICGDRNEEFILQNVSAMSTLTLNIELQHFSSKTLLLFDKLQSNLKNIVDISISADAHVSLSNCIKHLISMHKCLESLNISSNESLLAEHLSSLALSKHASSLRQLTIKHDGNLDIMQTELVNLIHKISGTVQFLGLQSSNFSGPFLKKIFNVAYTCKKLSILDIYSQGKIDSVSLEDAVILGGLPEFVLLKVTRGNEYVHLDNLLLSQSVNEFRGRHLTSEFQKRVRVELSVHNTLTYSDDDNDADEADNEFDDEYDGYDDYYVSDRYADTDDSDDSDGYADTDGYVDD